MVTREEAKDITLQGKGDTFKVHVMIDKIYDSIGRCDVCESSYINENDLLTCSRGSFEPIERDFFCADFIRREDEEA
jgi:hypothetical protein